MATSNMKFSVVLEAVTQAFNTAMKQAGSAYTQTTSSVRKDSDAMSAATQKAALDLQKVFKATDAKGVTDAIKSATRELDSMTNGAELSANELKRVGTVGKQAMSELRADLTRARAELQALSTTKAAPADLDAARTKVAELTRTVGDTSAAYQRFQGAAAAAMGRAKAASEDAAKGAQSAGKAIYDALNIKSGGTLRQEIADITRQLNQFRNATGVPANEIARVTAAAQAKIAQLRGELSGVGTSAQGSVGGIGSMASSLAGVVGVTAGLAGVTQGLRAIIDTTVEFQQVSKQLEFAVGSAQKAGQEFEFIRGVAKNLGIDLLSAAGGFAKLAAATKGTALEGQATRDIFLGISQASATMGLSIADTNGVMLAISQIAGKGKVSMEELRGQLGERLPPAMKIAADSMGVTVQQLDKLVENGLDAETFLAAFGPALQKAFQNDAAKNAATLQGQINLLRNEFKEMLNDFGNAGVANGAVSVFKDLNSAIVQVREALRTMDPTTVSAVTASFEGLYSIVQEVFKALGSAVDDVSTVLDSMLQLVTGVVSAFTGFSTAGEQVGFLTRVLQGVSVLLGAVSDGVSAISIAFTGVTGVVQSFFAAIAFGISKITFGDVSAQLEQLSIDLTNSAQKSFAKADEMAQGFTSKTQAAMDKAVQASTEAADKGATAHEQAATRTAAAQTAIGDAVAGAQTKIAEGSEQAVGGLKRVAVAATDTQTAVQNIVGAVNAARQSLEIFEGAGGKAVINVANATNEAKDAFNKLAKEVGVTLPAAAQNSATAVDDLGFALGRTAVANKQVADGIAKELPAAVAKLNAVDLAQFRNSFIKGLEDAGASADYVKQRLIDLATSSAKSIGVDLVASLKGLSQQFTDNKTVLLSLVQDFDKLKAAGVDSAKLVTDGLNAMLAKARNPVELQEMIRLFQQLGQEGKISGQAMADGIAQAKAKLDELKPGINSVAEAFKLVGLQTKEEATKMANDYRDAFAIIQSSGQATALQIEQAFTKYAQAAVAANGGVVSDFVRAEAAALGLEVQVDKTGNAIVSKMGQGADAADGLTRSVDGATSALERQNDILERNISAREKALDLAEREAALERKRKNVDKDGFTLDNNGNRLTISVITPESAFNAAKDAGLSDKTALAFRDKYASIGNKNDPRFGDFNAFYQELNRLKVEEAAQRVREEEAAKKGKNTPTSPTPSNSSSRTSGSQTTRTTPTQTTRPTTSPTSSSAGNSTPSRTVNVNMTLGGQTVNATVPAGQEGALLNILKAAKGVSS